MSYFQNLFNEEFRGEMSISDISNFNMTFKVPPNINTSRTMCAWNSLSGPFNFTGNDAGGSVPKKNLTFNISTNFGQTYASFIVDVTTQAANAAAETTQEIVNSLNANVNFNAWFTAIIQPANGVKGLNSGGYIFVNLTTPRVNENIKVYISNSGAESVLRFNKKAGVAQLPRFFARHTITNLGVYPDCQGLLVQLSGSPATEGNAAVPISGVDIQIVSDAGFSTATASLLTDYQLFRGRSGYFVFNNNTVDGSGRITQTIQYPAGAKSGDAAKKMIYTYTGANTNPTTYTEIPYVLQSADILTP